MDVFGTVVSAIGLIGKLIGHLQAVKDAKQDRLKLLLEVSALGALLEVLRGRLSNTSADDTGDSVLEKLVKAGIEAPLRVCCDALKSTVEGLERLVLGVKAGASSPLAERVKDFKWPFRQGDIGTMLGNIERLKSLISLALQTSLVDFIEKARDELATVGLNVEGIKSIVLSLEADQRAHLKQIESVQDNLVSLSARLQGAASGVTEIQNAVDRNQQEQKRRDIINWLSAPEFDRKHIAAFEQHAPGTGEWFLRHPKFTAWEQGECNVLWCPGNPGVGKSVLASAVINHLQTGIAENTAVAFVYFDYTTNYTARHLVGALLSQFMRRGMSSSSMKSLEKYRVSSRPTLRELWTVLEAEVTTYTRAFVVIDALDETDSSTWIKPIRRLRELPGIKVLVTSRDLGSIAVEFQADCRLDVMADEGDLRNYIERRLSGSTGSFRQMISKNLSLHAEIVSGVTQKADGMFLLARLHMNSLEMESRVVDLRRALFELPRDLKSAYDVTMDRINDKYKPLALRIFSWIIHAARPMSIDDLQYALAVEDGMETIQNIDFLHDQAHLTSVCLGLVVLRQEESPVGFDIYHYIGLVHYTIQDYLRDHLSTHLPHPAHLAITCLKYLSFDAFNKPSKDFDRELADTPLARYAVQSWGEHARVYWNDTIVHQLAMELLHDHRRVTRFGSIVCCTKNPSAIQLCTHFGLKEYALYLLDNGSDVNSKDSNGKAVMEAVVCGREEILQLLLAREGINFNSTNRDGATPLIQAVSLGRRRFVELLLARGDVNVNWRDTFGSTPIAHAAKYGHSDIVELLLARDNVNVNSQNMYGETPLTSAAIRGHEAVVQLLLARDDVNIHSLDEQGRAPLALAILKGHEAVVRLLLAREDLDINLKDNYGDTCLTLAAYCKDDKIAKLLLIQGGVDVNSKNLEGRTALSVAASEGHDAVMKVLLGQNDTDINAVDSNGNTPLDWAEEKFWGLKTGIWGERRKRGVVELLRAVGACRGVELRAEGFTEDQTGRPTNS